MTDLKQLDPKEIEIATQVRSRIKALQTEIDASTNPHRLAIKELGIIGKLGELDTPYNDGAYRLWSDMLCQNPDDVETRHHLAIVHQARAIDLEASGDPTTSNQDWEMAFSHWHVLWQSDDFWSEIARKALGEKGDASRLLMSDLREEFSVLLLRVHFDIAFDLKHIPHHRARFHLNLVEGGSFPPELIAQVREETYTHFVQDLPPTVWQHDMMDPDNIKLGTDRIRSYLERDPSCVPALEDALRLQDRCISSWFTEFQALDTDDSRRNPQLLSMQQSGGEWQEYFDQLEPRTGMTEDIRDKLGRWYYAMAQIAMALDQSDKAIALCKSGLAATFDEDEAHQLCRESLILGLTNSAIDSVNKATENAHFTRQKKLKVYRDGLSKLEEASQLAPENEHIRENHLAIKKLIKDSSIEG